MSTLFMHRLKTPVHSPDAQALHSVYHQILGAKQPSRGHAGQFTRLAALEARAAKRNKILQMLYLPVTFFLYGAALGELWCVQVKHWYWFL